MKRFITILVAIVMIASMVLITSATSSSGTTIERDGVTVVFESDSTFSIDKKNEIVDYIITDNIQDTSVTTYNLLCTLFGHKTTTESITVYEHCVRDAQPRCIRSLQDVTGCTRCDYVTTEVITSSYVYCCE